MAIKIGGTTAIDDGRNINGGIGTFTGLSVNVIPSIFDPALGATGIATDANIVLTFNQVITKGTGNITIRQGSSTGTAIGTVGVSSTSVTISGAVATIDPPFFLGINTTYYPVIDAGAFINSFGNVSVALTTYYFQSRPPTITEAVAGDTYQGGTIMCKNGGVAWIAAPSAATITGLTATWYNRATANTCAQTVTGVTGWFVPTASQLLNPGYVCRSKWDAGGPIYWSNTEVSASHACGVDYWDGDSNPAVFKTYCCAAIRSFRCVTY